MAQFSLEAPTKAQAAQALESAARKAAVALDLSMDDVATEIFDPQLAVARRQELRDFCYKVSGMSAKQATLSASSGFSIVINIPGAAQDAQTAIDVTPTLVAEPDPATALPDPSMAPHRLIENEPMPTDLGALPDFLSNKLAQLAALDFDSL